MIGRHRIVLVPTDFSHGAELALARALRLPFGPDARLVLLHVLPGELAEALRAEAEAVVRDSLAKLVGTVQPPAGVEIGLDTAFGDPFAQIIARARSLDAGLVVMGRHGRRAIRDLFIGSTTDRTIRYGDVPVLVVNLEPGGPYRRPVIATDLEDTARRVAELAASVLEPDVEISLVHAFRIPFEGLHYIARPSRLEHELEGQAREAMEKLLTSIGADRMRWKPSIRRGDARAVILTEIVARDADLVVLGTHGRSGLAHVVVGSVAEWVIAAARCDVLVTRPARFTFEMP